jgi:hypothetical protein
VQVASAVAVPAVYPNPSAHVPHAVQVAAFVVDENVPAAHGSHVRSRVVMGVRVTRVPAAQTVHARHVAPSPK